MKLTGVKVVLDSDERELVRQVRHDLFVLEEQPQSGDTLQSIALRMYSVIDMLIFDKVEEA